MPGQERLRFLTASLNQADIIVLLLSADFFASQECLRLLKHALLRQQTETVLIIPLLLRPVLWHASPLGTLACLPANAIPVLRWEDEDEGWYLCVQGLQRLVGRTPLRIGSVAATIRDRSNRAAFLRLLHRDYQRDQEESLERRIWLELGLSEHPDVVSNASHWSQRRPDRSERALPAGTSILQVYDEAEESLLILGDPGAGKSTLLRALALQLVTRAQTDEMHPLPVIFPLSSWAMNKAPLTTWMEAQLARIYAVPRTVARQWVQQGQILPLLDGLDEMEEKARLWCIVAINTYHRSTFTPLVVCSRTSEYRDASVRQRLVLQRYCQLAEWLQFLIDSHS